MIAVVATNGPQAGGKAASAVPTGLPPGPSLSRTRSEGMFRRLGRTDSANHAHEMEALQQVQLFIFVSWQCWQYQHSIHIPRARTLSRRTQVKSVMSKLSSLLVCRGLQERFSGFWQGLGVKGKYAFQFAKAGISPDFISKWNRIKDKLAGPEPEGRGCWHGQAALTTAQGRRPAAAIEEMDGEHEGAGWRRPQNSSSS